jgi:hypothetical protein
VNVDTKRLTLNTTLTLIAAYLGLFVGLVDANAINLALPAIRDDLGAGVAGAQWTIDAYNITFAALLLTSGSLGDRLGRRRVAHRGGDVHRTNHVGEEHRHLLVLGLPAANQQRRTARVTKARSRPRLGTTRPAGRSNRHPRPPLTSTSWH